MRKVSGILADTTELKRLILEHPDYPIVVLVSEEANNGDYSWMYASDITFTVGEILDKQQPFNQELIYSDRDSFEEDFEEWLWEDLHKRMEEEGSNCELDEEAFQLILKRELQQYEPHWKNCIIVRADN